MNLNVKKITGIALVSVLAYISMLLIKFPIQFLDLDIKDVIICIGGLIFGILPCLIISFLVAFLELITVSSSGIVGFFMNFTATIFFTLPIVILSKRKEKNIILGSILGIILMTISMVLFSLLITPIYLGTSLEEVIALLVPLIIPFNIGKGLLNAVLILVLNKPIIKTLKKANLV